MLTNPEGEIINTARLYVNVDCFVTIVPCASIPLTDNVLDPINGDGLGISDPFSEQSAVEVEVKLSYE